MVYFLLVDLMGFPRTGKEEKVAWTIPVEFNGRGYSIEHRKFGLGVFATDHPDAEEITKRIRKAVRLSEPFFDWHASEAAKQSHLNVINLSQHLFDRYEYFLGQYEARRQEAEARKDEVIKTTVGNGTTYHFPAGPLRREAKWLALSTIESFFSWTEHVLILTTKAEIDMWLTAPREEAITMQRPLADDVLKIVSVGFKQDSPAPEALA